MSAMRTRKSEMSVMKKVSPRRMLSKGSDDGFHLPFRQNIFVPTLVLCSYLHTKQSRLGMVNTLGLGPYFVG